MPAKRHTHKIMNAYREARIARARRSAVELVLVNERKIAALPNGLVMGSREERVINTRWIVSFIRYRSDVLSAVGVGLFMIHAQSRSTQRIFTGA